MIYMKKQMSWCHLNNDRVFSRLCVYHQTDVNKSIRMKVQTYQRRMGDEVARKWQQGGKKDQEAAGSVGCERN